jgi:hypothetical protein
VLSRDGQELLPDAAFAEASPMVCAISFRTGAFRDSVGPIISKDVPNTEEPVPGVSYRVDDVTTDHHTFFTP